MRVDLRLLKPNPMRDFSIDPIDPEAVEKLRQSIADDGFWGGVVCRQLPSGEVQIGAGHHRVAAAIQAGIAYADLFVADKMDDGKMIRVYARENATQRGHTSTALTGTIASALRYTAKAALTGAVEEFFHGFDMGIIRQRLLHDEDGLGWTILLAFLHDIPGINAYSVKHQLANLKTSGNYARLIAEVEQDIADEAATAQRALEEAEREQVRRQRETSQAARDRAEQARAEAETKQQATAQAHADAQEAAANAAQQTKTFDFEGVAQHFKNPHQVDTFRTLVTDPDIVRKLAVEQQAPLAAQLVAYCHLHGEEVSGDAIRRHFTIVLLQAQSGARQASREDAKEAEEHDKSYVVRRAMWRFGKHVRGLTSAGRGIAKELEEWPAEKEVPAITDEFRKDLYRAVSTLNSLYNDERFHYEPKAQTPKAQTPNAHQHHARKLLPVGQEEP